MPRQKRGEQTGLVGKCSCGHIQTLHGQETKYKEIQNRTMIERGHGGCHSKGCDCPQFTWSEFVAAS